MSLTESRHGGDIFGMSSEEQNKTLDFSININPLGLSPMGKRELFQFIETDILRYPDIKCRELIKALSNRYDMKEDCISVGNGATELMYMLLRVLKPKQVYIPAPGFSEYRLSAESVGADIIEFFLLPNDNFSIPVKEFVPKIKSNSVIFLGNPNNPDGQCLSEEVFSAIMETAAERNSFVIIDESFIDFLGDPYSYRHACKKYKNLIIIMSLTKFYAVPGLRIGCSFSSPDITDKLKDNLIPWNVNGPVQRYMVKALEDKMYQSDTIRYCADERKKMTEELQAITDIQYCGGEVNFILFRLIGKFKNAEELQEKLFPEHILIRQCGNYSGLDEKYFRIAVKTDEENKKLVKAFRKVFEK